MTFRLDRLDMRGTMTMPDMGAEPDERRSKLVKETAMVAVMLMSVVLIGVLCFVAYTLATYALPFILGLAAARFAYDTGSGLIGAGLVGLAAGATAFGLLVFLFAFLRPPILRLLVALVFAAPAAMAGYALVHGVTHEAVPSEIWRTIFCIIGGAFVGVSALLRLSAPMDMRSAWASADGLDHPLKIR